MIITSAATAIPTATAASVPRTSAQTVPAMTHKLGTANRASKYAATCHESQNLPASDACGTVRHIPSPTASTL